MADVKSRKMKYRMKNPTPPVFLNICMQMDPQTETSKTWFLTNKKWEKNDADLVVIAVVRQSIHCQSLLLEVNKEEHKEPATTKRGGEIQRGATRRAHDFKPNRTSVNIVRT